MSIHVGVVAVDRGGAIVTVERDADDGLVCIGIERLPFDLDAVAERVRALPEDARVVIDADGIGNALWAVVGRPTDPQHWDLYTGRGVERQALVDELLVVIHQGRFHFAPDLAEQAAMTQALLSYRRQVRDDGLIGSELVVALCLALRLPPPVFSGPFAISFDDYDD